VFHKIITLRRSGADEPAEQDTPIAGLEKTERFKRYEEKNGNAK
jgi:hypothetical protein